MKKSFYFALALTAGLFASCSSDEIAQAPNGGPAVDDNTPVKIEIGIADDNVVTRGTGRVGSTAGTAATQWEGQKFNVLMLEKGTMMGARLTPADPTTAILKGTGMTATGTNVMSLDVEARYYPNYKQDGVSTGVYDFWGYRLDNSETPTAGTPVFNGYDVAAGAATPAHTDAVEEADATNYDAAAVGDKSEGDADALTAYTIETNNGKYFHNTANDKYYKIVYTAEIPGGAAANQITVPFKINGTQDIMIAETTPSDAAYAAANPTAIYSAKSARNGVKPTMAFKHLLTSLTFKVKPKSIDISDQATNPTTDVNWVAGYQITNITLKSKATGELIVAYTPDNVVADKDRIIWAAGQDWADPTTLTEFQLQCRPKEVNDKADIKMVAISSAALTGHTVTYAAGYVDMTGASSYVVPDRSIPANETAFMALSVYPDDDLSTTTGLPETNKTTLGALKTAAGADVTGYILTYKSAARTSHTTTDKYYECDYKASAAGVTENLARFYDNAEVYKTVLGWTGNTAGSAAHTDWVASDATEYGAAGAKAIDTYAAVDYNAATHDVLLDQANDGNIYNFNGTYKKVVYTAAVPASGGTPTVSAVGEPMLVAPSNDAANSGYQVVVTYKYWKKKTTSEAVLTEVDSKPITVNNYSIDPSSGNKILSAFEAGKNYNVTLTLYSDGEVLNGEATSEPWEDGGDLDAGED